MCTTDSHQENSLDLDSSSISSVVQFAAINRGRLVEDENNQIQSRPHSHHEFARDVEKTAGTAQNPELSPMVPQNFEKAAEDLKIMKEMMAGWEADPEHPRNWKTSKKALIIFIASLYNIVSPLNNTMLAAALLKIAEKYHIMNPSVLGLTASAYLLTFAFGPLICAPISEVYGRRWIMHIGIFTMIAFNIGSAYAKTTGQLIGYRLLCGLAAALPTSVTGGLISDLYPPKDRATATAVLAMGPLFDPAIGPVVGGVVAQHIDVKWLFLISAAVGAFAQICGLFFLHETYAPVLLSKKLKTQGEIEKYRVLKQSTLNGATRIRYLWTNFSRPILLLTTNMTCFLLSAYISVLFGIYYLMLVTFGEVFNAQYGFSAQEIGLVYIGPAIGFLLNAIFGTILGNWIYRKHVAKNNGVEKPEYRIPPMVFTSIAVPIGLLWYGWSAQAKLHWIIPIIGTAIFGYGLMSASLQVQLYLLDSFTYAASALAGSYTFFSLFGFAFPLFGQDMYNTLGLGGGSSLLAGLGVIFGTPFPIWLYYNGEKMRAKSKSMRR